MNIKPPVKRTAAALNLPPLSSYYLGFESADGHALFNPANTPAAIVSINDLPITEAERKLHWPRTQHGRRPDDHLGLSQLCL